MQVVITEDDKRVCLALSGEIDADNCVEVSRAVADTGVYDRPLEVDMTEVTFIDSSGVSELLALRPPYEENGQAIRIVKLSRPVRRVLEVTGLLDTFGVPSHDISD